MDQHFNVDFKNLIRFIIKHNKTEPFLKLVQN